jgi:hydrogenase nickel incorporation protein HypA/HybF
LHELGIVCQVADTVIAFAEKHGVSKIDTVVLQIGELSPVVPRYVEACYPAAVDGTALQDTKLKIEIIPGTATCRQCGHEFPVRGNGRVCPTCRSPNVDITGGRDFIIKEIVAY